jgi:hypothetical protein
MYKFIHLTQLLAAAVLAATCSLASAAPYTMTYMGTMGASTIPGITTGQAYKVQLVLDNGGATTVSQTWVAADIKQVIWTFNNASNVVFTHNAVTLPPNIVAGTVTTNGAGALLTNFTDVVSINGVGNGFYTVIGAALVANVTWYANGGNAVFFDSSGGRSVNSTGGGVIMAPAGWVLAPVVAAAPVTVPTLSQWGTLALGLLLASAAALTLRRRRG